MGLLRRVCIDIMFGFFFFFFVLFKVRCVGRRWFMGIGMGNSDAQLGARHSKRTILVAGRASKITHRPIALLGGHGMSQELNHCRISMQEGLQLFFGTEGTRRIVGHGL